MKLPCSGLLLNIEVCYLRTWKRGELFLFILNKHTRYRRVCIAALIKTTHQSGRLTLQERLLLILQLLSQVFRRLKHLLMKQQSFKIFFYVPLTCFTAFFLF